MNNFLDQISVTFKALGDPQRLKILRLVATKKHDFYVSEIAKKLGITNSAVSQHLKVLKNARIVEPVRDGFHTYYRMRKGAVADFRKNIDRLIRVGFLDCTFDGPCSECPDKKRCLEE
ncbi:MAG: winged helix-turn-helix transcriptional regulator [Anaerolineales bacterium]|nr:winged helix-turn-helix transcriptional regulator [Anaerolineales bacterium]